MIQQIIDLSTDINQHIATTTLDDNFGYCGFK